MTQIENAIQAFESQQAKTPEQEEAVYEQPDIQVLREGTFFNVTLRDIERRFVNPGEDSDYLLLIADEDKYNQITGVIIGGTLNSGEIENLAKNPEIQKTPGESWYVVKDDSGLDFLTWTGDAFEAVIIPRKGGGHEGEPGEPGPVEEVVTEPVKEDPVQDDPIPPESPEPHIPPPIIDPDPTPTQEPQDIPEPAPKAQAPEVEKPKGLPPSVETVKTKKIIDMKKSSEKGSINALSNLKVIQLRK